MTAPAPPRRIKLPKPAIGQHVPLITGLERRRTHRAIAPRPLSLQMLSNLLWAAWGINRLEGPSGRPGRTAASAGNAQQIDLYVALATGAFLYDPVFHGLDLVAPHDLRPAGQHDGQAAPAAPVVLIYVADRDRLGAARESGFSPAAPQESYTQEFYAYVDAGLIAGNVYLFAAAAGLAAWFHHCDHTALAVGLGLAPARTALFAHSVGYAA